MLVLTDIRSQFVAYVATYLQNNLGTYAASDGHVSFKMDIGAIGVSAWSDLRKCDATGTGKLWVLPSMWI